MAEDRKTKPKRTSGKAGEGGAKAKPNPSLLQLNLKEGQTPEEVFAETALESAIRHAQLATNLGNSSFKDADSTVCDINRSVGIMRERCEAVRAGNLDSATDMLTAQMATLDALFSEMTGRAMKNMGQYAQAVQIYMNLALKAQTNCRVTAEALAKIKRGGKQTVRVVHVYPGGQAVVADTVNTGGNAGSGGGSVEQPYRATAVGEFEALLCPDPSRDGLPLASDAERSLSDSWGAEPWGAEGEPERVEARRAIG